MSLYNSRAIRELLRAVEGWDEQARVEAVHEWVDRWIEQLTVVSTLDARALEPLMPKDLARVREHREKCALRTLTEMIEDRSYLTRRIEREQINTQIAYQAFVLRDIPKEG